MLGLSLIGIILISIITSFQEPKYQDIEEINKLKINSFVKTEGIVSGIRKYENNFTTFTLKDNYSRIQVICNCPKVEEKDHIEVIGKITEYQKIIQIEAEQINTYLN